jgi:hypothetical protein
MDSTTFKKLLFEVACCTMACDFDIDEKETQELHSIDKSTAYFKSIDLSMQLEDFLADITGNETEGIKELVEKRINELVERIKDAILSPVEELLILEIILRLMYADTVIHENETKLLNSVRHELSLSDEVITDRFGKIDMLIKNPKMATSSDEKIVEKKGFNAADVNNLENLYSKIDDDKKEQE